MYNSRVTQNKICNRCKENPRYSTSTYCRQCILESRKERKQTGIAITPKLCTICRRNSQGKTICEYCNKLIHSQAALVRYIRMIVRKRVAEDPDLIESIDSSISQGLSDLYREMVQD